MVGNADSAPSRKQEVLSHTATAQTLILSPPHFNVHVVLVFLSLVAVDRLAIGHDGYIGSFGEYTGSDLVHACCDDQYTCFIFLPEVVVRDCVC